ncbi:hypothetical protein OBBRIDRAFT_86022 [Obba rivulosa]|uniref:dihydroneopterin aldolase n=1 Tax=Obba rivulosa TaxID=1052685 RepID=A0A8E2DIR0_9APHY|nr:hypothetical protein OBBRIDRAFT_86022 [Obba rivulosa]
MSTGMPIDDISSDVVYLSSLSVSANIGPDWWGRARAQPLSISVSIHLQDTALNAAAADDDVTASVHYGHLCKDVLALAEKPGAAWRSAVELAKDVARLAAQKAAGRAREVRVVVCSAKMVPLAEEYAVEVTVSDLEGDLVVAMVQRRVKVTVKDLVIPVIIGVNPPEREKKQRVVTDIVVFEKVLQPHFVDYPGLVAKLAQKMEATAYLTLEKFALELVREVCLASVAVEKVAVRAAKPSALAFADVAGVQICRPRSVFVNPA